MANLIVATTNNNEPMNQAVMAVARSHIARGEGDHRGPVERHRGCHPRIRPVPELCNARGGTDAPDSAALRRGRARDCTGDQGVSGLVLGYGNPGRGDDGVGVRLVEMLETAAPRGVDVEAAIQPGIEHAAAVAEHDWVVFVDAAAAGRARRARCAVVTPCPVPRSAPTWWISVRSSRSHGRASAAARRGCLPCGDTSSA